MNEPIEVKGVNGTVVFDGRSIIIRRSGFIGQSTSGKGDKSIPVSRISAVQWKAARVSARKKRRKTRTAYPSTRGNSLASSSSGPRSKMQ